MKKALYIAVVVVLVCAIPAFRPVKAVADDFDERQVTICHVPPGNPGNPLTITIGESAVPHHLANHPGDHVGACIGHCPGGGGPPCP